MEPVEQGTGPDPKTHAQTSSEARPVLPREPVDIPRWLPPLLYAAVTVLLFRKFVFTGEMLFGQDTLSLGFMARDFFAQALRDGVFPLWNPVILGGTPFLDSLAGGDSLYPTSLLLLVLEPYRALGWKLVVHVFLAGLFTYGWIRALGLSRAAALLAGLAYLLAPFIVTLVYPGHDGKLFVTALTPLLFWATERSFARSGIGPLALTSIVIALVILTTHFQQAYFLFGAVGVYAAVRTVTLWRSGGGPRRALSRFGLFLLFSVLGAGMASIQLLPAVGYVLESSRRTVTTTRATEEGSMAYSSSWSMHPEEALSMVVPEFAGNSAGGAGWTENTYWGRNIFKLNHEYAGLVVLLLASLSFLGGPRREVRLTLAVVGAVALLYALGTHTPVWRIFFELVPGISLFRAPSIAAFLFGFGAVTLMAFGAERVLLGPPDSRPAGGESEGAQRGSGKKARRGTAAPDRSGRDLHILAAATGFLLLGTILAASGTLTSAWNSILYSELTDGKAEALLRAEPFIVRGFFLAMILAAATWALTWAVRGRRIPPAAWLAGVALLVVVDLARVDDPFIQTQSFREWSAPDPTIRHMTQQVTRDDPFRVFSMLQRGQDVKPGMYGLELAAGHHPNDLARYRELIGMVGSGEPAHLFDPATGQFGLSLFQILNIRYLLWPSYQYGPIPGIEPVSQATLAGGRPYLDLYELPTLPRARLVGEAIVLPEEETVPYLRSPQFRPAEEVVLTEPPPISLGGGEPGGEVRWVEKGINRLRLRVQTDASALLVLAENWYPAWKARVDGQETAVLRANHTLRAIPVAPGEHDVEVYYDAASLRLPLVVSLLSLLGVLAVGWLGRRRETDPGAAANG
jgi:hypothetical protein